MLLIIIPTETTAPTYPEMPYMKLMSVDSGKRYEHTIPTIVSARMHTLYLVDFSSFAILPQKPHAIGQAVV